MFGRVGGVVDGVDHRPRAICWAETAFGRPRCTVPQSNVAALLLGQPPDDVFVQINAYRPREPQCFVVVERRCAKCVPRKDEPRCHGVKLGIRFHVCELFKPPPLHLAARSVECILRRHCIGIERFLEHLGLPTAFQLLWLRARGAPLQRPMPRELLERGSEGGEVKIDTANASFAEALNIFPDGRRHQRLHVFPIQRLAHHIHGAVRTTYEEDRAVAPLTCP